MGDLIKQAQDFAEANSVAINIGLGALVFLIAIVIRNKLSVMLLSLISKLFFRSNEKKKEALISSLKKPLAILIFVMGLYLSIAVATQKFAFAKPFKIIVILIVCWGVTSYQSGNMSSILNVKSGDDGLNVTAVKFISNLFKIMIIALAVVMIISELGYNINGLITGLGVGGLAISLAAQDAVSNLISGFIIVLDKPFKVGEFIETKDISGTVLEVSMRTTKIRTVDDSVVTVPNSELTGGAIFNVSRKNMRLIDTEVALTYSTSNELLEKCMEDIREYLRENERIVNEPIRVELAELDDSALNINVFCYTTETDIHKFYGVLSEVNLNMKKIVEANGADFAFPSTSVYIEKK